jgi:hypothetical protein
MNETLGKLFCPQIPLFTFNCPTMKFRPHCAIIRIFLSIVGLTTALPSTAAVVISGTSSQNEMAFASDVSPTDLLQGLSATVSGPWQLIGGATPANLNNGVHGATYDIDGAASVAWGFPGSSATYELGPGNGYGWDITSIQSIAAWVNVGFGNQAYTVSARFIGDLDFTALPTLSVDYQPLTTGTPVDPGATRVIITDTDGVLIHGIDAIRFTMTSVNGGLNNGAFTFREIDVEGTMAVPEPASAALMILGASGLLIRRRVQR